MLALMKVACSFGSATTFPRGSWKRSFEIDYIFDLVFHMSLNSCNTKLKKWWGSLGIAT